MASEDLLRVALADGACLVDSAPATLSLDLKSVLVNRLSRYYDRRGSGSVSHTISLEEIQFITAREALSVVGRVQRVLGGPDTDAKTTDNPLIGNRDLGELRTLLSVVFKWGVDPLLSKVVLAWPSKDAPPETKEPRIIDLTTSAEDYELLFSLVSQLMSLLFPSDMQDGISQTLITTTMLDRHAIDLLRPCITLGWVPKYLASDSRPPLDAGRPFTMRLLSFLQPSKAIIVLGAILSSAPNVLPHVRKACATLLSQQLLRPQGVRGLCAAVFSEERPTNDDAPIEKIEHIARVLTTVPASMKPHEYFHTIIPRITDLLSSQESPAHTRAAAFTISRMLSPIDPVPHRELASGIIFSFLHQPFLEVLEGDADKTSLPSQPPTTALSTLITLVSNADPSPTLMTTLLSPITPAIYSLFHYMEKVKASDPTLKESLHGLLVTWGKIVSQPEGVAILWHIITSNDRGGWQVDLEGHISKVAKSERPSQLSLLTPEDLRRANEADELHLDMNILDLYPDPVSFVRFLKDIDRVDISSDLFVKLLEVYRIHKSQASDPMRTLLYLQITIQMQTQLSDGKTSSNILYKPAHLLSFIKHVLEAVDPRPLKTHDRAKLESTLRLDELHLHEVESELADEGDSDDDTPGSEVIGVDQEMIETALNLLLAILEANEDLSARTTPVLNDIFSLLEPLAKEASSAISPLAREAQMVMTARLASTSALGSSGSRRSAKDHDSTQEIYQKALKLLQDPILPVRAHGLLLLRQLISPASRGSNKPTLDDYAVVPAILSIFLQSIRDDDSYLFLNAVQGLAVMAYTFGKDVLRNLVGEYAGGLDGLRSVNLTQHDVDTRIRLGEALGIVIRQSGDALSIHADMLVPPLLRTLRSQNVPTVLRMSSISLLAECVKTDTLSMLPYLSDLGNTIVDLLQLETVSTNPRSSEKGDDTADQAPTMDSNPTSTNSKFPPFRRAAVHFLSLLFRETTKQIYESSFGGSVLPDGFIRIAKTTLSYVASTDQDTLVRVMAREAGEGLQKMQQAMIGL
ncbi:hypothetical protein L208DRAFT_1361765 [Tricholoma matsutake]|nr:hypothetical protein L208DRAFT_1361765 [Tricholoma matsutake 945]